MLFPALFRRSGVEPVEAIVIQHDLSQSVQLVRCFFWQRRERVANREHALAETRNESYVVAQLLTQTAGQGVSPPVQNR